MEEMGDQLEADEKANIENAIKELEDAMKTDDKDAIEAKTKALTDASGKMAERMYAQQQAEGTADPGAQADAGASSDAGDDVVDAEFEEVKDDK